jgi:hypothetical protein
VRNSLLFYSISKMERSDLSYVSCCSAAVMPVDAEKLEEQLSL